MPLEETAGRTAGAGQDGLDDNKSEGSESSASRAYLRS